MSNRPNHRRRQARRSEHGPRWENPDPGHGCNSTHVARARRSWKRIAERGFRRTGRTPHGYWGNARQSATSDDE